MGETQEGVCHSSTLDLPYREVHSMFHTNRRWSLTAVTLDQLEDDLFNYTLVLCTAYKTPAGVIWANNATGINAAQEFAVLVKRQDQLVEVESISTGWCLRDRLTRMSHRR